jgi:phage replication initiation protein
MTNNIPCKVDALSLTWSPKELLRIKDLAKIGACIKGEIVTNSKNAALTRHLQTLKTKKDSDLLNVAAFDANGYKDVLNRYQTACTEITREYNNRRHKDISLKTSYLSSNEVAARYELRQMLDGELEVDTAVKYDDRINNLLENIGVDLLDVLCCGEAERFVCRLNHVFTAESYMWTVQANSTGRFNYQYSANLYADGEHAGIIAWGGKNLGCYVSFMGLGCDALDMARVYEEIKNIPAIKITRIDLAHDDFAGKRSINVARKYAKQGGFCSGGRPASYMYIESGHLNKKIQSELKKQYKFIPDKGRSLYVGSRQSGKLLRVYEKGIQMGDPNDKWVRWELELHSSQRIIPLDAMIKPSEYLAGAYPALAFLNEEQNVIKTTIKKARMSIERIIENQVISTRKAINMMRVLCDMSDNQIIDKFLSGVVEPYSKAWLPQRLSISITEQQFLDQIQLQNKAENHILTT